MKQLLTGWTRVPLFVVLVVFFAGASFGKNIKWKRNGTGRADNNWNTTSVNWTDGSDQAYAEGDNVTFDCYAHYAVENYTSIVDSAGVSPGAFLINNPWCCNSMLFTNGDIKGSCRLTVTNNWVNPNLHVYFDGYTSSLSFSGGTFINLGTVHYRPSAPGSNNFGSGRITITNGTFRLAPFVNGVTNWNDFTVHSNGTLRICGGTIDGSKIDVRPGGSVIFDTRAGDGQSGTESRNIYLYNGLCVSATSSLSEVGFAGRYPTNFYYGNITVGTGGVLRLLNDGQYGRAGQHGSGDLRLLGASTVNMQFGWASGGGHLTYCYGMQTNTQKLYLGDGSTSTTETITFRGGGLSCGDNGPGLGGGFFFGTDSSNVVDDGATILRYETTATNGRLQFGWAGLGAVKGMTCCGCFKDYVNPFRGGTAGTIFAPYNTSNCMLSAVGASTGIVFTITNSARVITEGKLGFYNWGNAGNVNRCGYPGPVEIRGGSFSMEGTNIIVEASSIVVTNGGTLRGCGTLMVSNLVLSSSSELVYNLSSTNPSNEVIRVTGDLTLDGNVSVANRNYGPMPGITFTLLTCDGTITDNGLTKSFAGVISVVGKEVRVTVPLRGTVFIVH